MTSSNPLEDDEERLQSDVSPADLDAPDRQAALDAMPGGNAEQGDTVAEEPDDPDVSDWDPQT